MLIRMLKSFVGGSPNSRIGRKVELCLLLDERQPLLLSVGGHPVTKGRAVIIRTKDNVHSASRPFRESELQLEFFVVISYRIVLPEGVRPACVVGGFVRFKKPPLRSCTRVGTAEVEPESRIGDDLLASNRNRIGERFRQSSPQRYASVRT